MGCAANDLDVSHSVFDKLTEKVGENERYYNVEWHWL
jgi:hypothetical protein